MYRAKQLLDIRIRNKSKVEIETFIHPNERTRKGFLSCHDDKPIFLPTSFLSESVPPKSFDAFEEFIIQLAPILF